MATAIKEKENVFGNKLREVRKAKGITQKDLCARTHISHGSLSNYELGIFIPKDDVIDRLAKELGTTAAELKGENENKPTAFVKTSVSADPQPFKTALKNHEGYIDSTANKAVAIVMSNGKTSGFVVGDVVAANSNVRNEQVMYVILAIVGERSWVSELTKTIPDDNNYIYAIRNGAHVYYADVSKITTRYTSSLKKKLFSTPELTMNKISDRFKGCMFPISEFIKPVPVTIPEEKKEEEPDEISKIFADSISYFNEKNGTSIEVPKGVVTLQQAIDISNKYNLPLNDLIKDHTEDRVLDEICLYEAKIAELKAKIGL